MSKGKIAGHLEGLLDGEFRGWKLGTILQVCPLEPLWEGEIEGKSDGDPVGESLGLFVW